MKTIFLIIGVIFSFSLSAQVTKVTIQASGLTCSMCSNSINKALKTVPYVDKVMANIKTSSFEITFKPNSQVDFDQLKKKVQDAGFSVARFTANVNFKRQALWDDEHINVGNTTFHFLNVKNQEIFGERTILLLDKGYVTSKEFKKNNALTKLGCYKTGIADVHCTKMGAATAGKRIFHVTFA